MRKPSGRVRTAHIKTETYYLVLLPLWVGVYSPGQVLHTGRRTDARYQHCLTDRLQIWQEEQRERAGKMMATLSLTGTITSWQQTVGMRPLAGRMMGRIDKVWQHASKTSVNSNATVNFLQLNARVQRQTGLTSVSWCWKAHWVKWSNGKFTSSFSCAGLGWNFHHSEISVLSVVPSDWLQSTDGVHDWSTMCEQMLPAHVTELSHLMFSGIKDVFTAA